MCTNVRLIKHSVLTGFPKAEDDWLVWWLAVAAIIAHHCRHVWCGCYV